MALSRCPANDKLNQNSRFPREPRHDIEKGRNRMPTVGGCGKVGVLRLLWDSKRGGKVLLRTFPRRSFSTAVAQCEFAGLGLRPPVGQSADILQLAIDAVG
jgi:hypothetical protein